MVKLDCAINAQFANFYHLVIFYSNLKFQQLNQIMKDYKQRSSPEKKVESPG